MEKMGSCPRSPKLTQLNLGLNSFPVFAPLVWHAGHADGEATWFGMPGMTLLTYFELKTEKTDTSF